MTRPRYALVFVSDRERSAAFYRDVLGCRSLGQLSER
jgi:catechol 2,3-dioxygenase-like lactoylglutathione lyase family enzyme